MEDDVVRPDAGARTHTRLTIALLGYFVLVTLVITLSPFDFGPRPVRLSMHAGAGDVLANIALFLPLGFLMRGFDSVRTWPHWQAVALAGGFSLVIETAQLFLDGRYASPVDLSANASGAYVGLVLRDRVERWTIWSAGIVGRAGLDIPLVGLLYLLVPQLWLSGVGLAEDARRSVTTLLLGCAGSIVLVALHRHRWQGGTTLAARAVPPLAVTWFMAGAMPALASSPQEFGVLLLTVLAATLLLMRWGMDGDLRRFETNTLKRFLPVFATYVVVTTLWPPFRSVVPWHGALGFANRLNDAGVVDVLVLLEQVGAFTLLGYVLAEWRGRRELPLSADVPRVMATAILFAGSLEAVQGVLSGPGASLMRVVLATTGAVYGAAVYHLARAHVRALRAGQPASADGRHVAA